MTDVDVMDISDLSNQYRINGTEAFRTACAGANDFLSGRTATEFLLDGCAKSLAIA
jgi:hypothetical protein